MNACMELYFSIFKRLAESGGGGYSNLARRVIDEGGGGGARTCNSSFCEI